MFEFDEFWKRWTKLAGVQDDVWCADYDELTPEGRDTWRSEESDVRFNFGGMEFYGDRTLECEVEEDNDDRYLTLNFMLVFNPVIPGDDDYDEEDYTKESIRDANAEWKDFVNKLTRAAARFGEFTATNGKTYPVCKVMMNSSRVRADDSDPYDLYLEARMEVAYTPQ